MQANSGSYRPSADDSFNDTPSPISLKAVLSAATFFQCENVVATSMALDIHELEPGQLAMFRGGLHEPLEFAAFALAHGAVAILSDQLLPCPLPQVIVADVDRAACELANEFFDRPSQQLLMIGVVGNAGKTTTSLMIAAALREQGIRTAYETDLGSSDGIVQSVDELDRALGAELILRMADARDAGCGAVVVEFSAALAAAHDGIEFDLLVVTGSASQPPTNHDFGPDPLMVALEHVASDGVVIVPADHPKLVRRVDDSGHRKLTYGLRREADVNGKVFDSQPGEMTLMVSCGDETVAMETRHCGEAMAMNQIAAVSLLLLLETKLAEATETVSRSPYAPGRMQRMSSLDSAGVVIDAAGDGTRAGLTLRALRQQTCGGKLWCVLTLDATGTIGDDSLAIMGRMVERYAHRVVLTSTADHKDTFLHSAHAVLDGFRSVAVARLVSDQKSAVQWAIKHAAPNDTIVVLGGTAGGNAHQRRSRIQSLEKLVSGCQTGPAVARYSSPVTLPMPGVVTGS